MPGIDDSYIVHCAVTRCTMGLRESKLVLEKGHGVYLKEKAQATVRDVKAGENIICFGGCKCMENPKMLETLREMAERVDRRLGVSYQSFTDEELMKIYMATSEDGQKIMTCYTECVPKILTSEWDQGKEDVLLEGGREALLGKASVACKYGGMITIETTGQEE